MKRKHKCNCDHLAREIIERNLRGIIEKSNHPDDATDSEKNGANALADANALGIHPSDIGPASRKEDL